MNTKTKTPIFIVHKGKFYKNNLIFLGTRKIKCPLCGKLLNGNEKLKNHQKIHVNSLNFTLGWSETLQM
jgi:hypothetical protein